MVVRSATLLLGLALASARPAGADCAEVIVFGGAGLFVRVICTPDGNDPPDHSGPPPIRTIRNRCRDGSPRCDADRACDGACTFVTCADPGCETTLPVVVPLRRGGRAPGKFVLPPAAGATLVLLCLPRRGTCPVTPTTTLPEPR
jgi:hypothetical protein